MPFLNSSIQSFHQLGAYLRLLLKNQFKTLDIDKIPFDVGDSFNLIQNQLVDYIENSHHYNAWFTQESIHFALKEWASLLTVSQLEEWIKPYSIDEDKNPKTIGVVMAGNIPMVGFHDYLCVLLSGHNLLAKLSSDDNKLIPILNDILLHIDEELAQKARFTNDQLSGFDAVIATGSNNTSRYFEYYFEKYPHIIRKNRNGVAVLKGEESEQELFELANDIFSYFGLGCRNVSKIFVPKNYEFRKMFECFESYNQLQNHSKYYNNYEYQKTIYLVNKTLHRDNGFALFKEDHSYASPIGVIYYEEYDDINDLKTRLEMDSGQIQCSIGKDYLNFGSSQKPKLNDYADGVDTLEFLINLSN